MTEDWINSYLRYLHEDKERVGVIFYGGPAKWEMIFPALTIAG